MCHVTWKTKAPSSAGGVWFSANIQSFRWQCNKVFLLSEKFLWKHRGRGAQNQTKNKICEWPPVSQRGAFQRSHHVVTYFTLIGTLHWHKHKPSSVEIIEQDLNPNNKSVMYTVYSIYFFYLEEHNDNPNSFSRCLFWFPSFVLRVVPFEKSNMINKNKVNPSPSSPSKSK